jgi:hypothetical protein
LAVAVPLRLLNGNVRVTQEWSPLEKLACLILLSAALGFVWLWLASGRDEQTSSGRTVCLLLVAVGTAVTLTLSGVLTYGQLCGAIAAAIAGTAVATWSTTVGPASRSTRSPLQGIPGAAGVITFSLGSLIILGRFAAELSTLNAALLFVSMAVAGGPLPQPISRRPLWTRLTVRSLLCLTPLAFAILIALD